jgi:hypothetical protein
MLCPRCKSSRIQRGYNAVAIPLRLIGMHELLCNNCGLEFKSLDPFGRFKRAPSAEEEPVSNRRRRAPRYTAHLPATIRLADKNTETGMLSYSRPSRGHCEVISKLGVGLAFVGTRFSEEEVERIGRLLFVTIDLPSARIEAVVTVLNHRRSGIETGTGKWLIGGTFSNMSDEDVAHLSSYLEKRAEAEPVLVTD